MEKQTFNDRLYCMPAALSNTSRYAWIRHRTELTWVIYIMQGEKTHFSKPQASSLSLTQNAATVSCSNEMSFDQQSAGNMEITCEKIEVSNKDASIRIQEKLLWTWKTKVWSLEDQASSKTNNSMRLRNKHLRKKCILWCYLRLLKTT